LCRHSRQRTCSGYAGSLADIGGAGGIAAKSGRAADGGAAAAVEVGATGSGVGAGSGEDASSGEGAHSGAGMGSGSEEEGGEDDSGEDGGREDDSEEDDSEEGGSRRSGGESWISLEMGVIVKGNRLGGDSGRSIDGSGMDGGGDEVYRMIAVLGGGLCPPHHPLAVPLHIVVSWSILLVVKWAVVAWQRLGRWLLMG
jgi:hypothetical protein